MQSWTVDSDLGKPARPSPGQLGSGRSGALGSGPGCLGALGFESIRLVGLGPGVKSQICLVGCEEVFDF